MFRSTATRDSGVVLVLIQCLVLCNIATQTPILRATRAAAMDATTTAPALSLCPDVDGGQTRSPPQGPGQPQKSDPGQAQHRNRGCQVCRPCFITPEAPRISSVWAPLTPSRMPLRASVAAALTRPRGRGTDNDALIWALEGQGVERMGESAGRVLWFKAVKEGKAAARQSELLAESARQAWHPPGLSWPLARKCLLVPLTPYATFISLGCHLPAQ